MNKITDRLISLEKKNLVDRLGVFQPKINRYPLGQIDAVNGFEFTRIIKAKNYSQATICISTNIQTNVEVKLNKITLYNANTSMVVLPVILMAENNLVVSFNGDQNVYATITISGNVKADKYYTKTLYLNADNPVIVSNTLTNYYQINDVNLVKQKHSK